MTWSRLFKDVSLTLLASGYPWVNPPQRIHGTSWVSSCRGVLSFPRASSEGSCSAFYDLAWEVTSFISTVFYWLHRFLMSFGRWLHKSINTRGWRSWGGGGILQVATTADLYLHFQKRERTFSSSFDDAVIRKGNYRPISFIDKDVYFFLIASMSLPSQFWACFWQKKIFLIEISSLITHTFGEAEPDMPSVLLGRSGWWFSC